MFSYRQPPVLGILAKHLWASVHPGRFVRYAGVGACNTLVGFGSFAVFQHLIGSRIPNVGFMLASLLSSFFSISVAFLGYKFFVFKTRGNALREWLLCFAVYGSSVAVGLVLLPALVFVIRRSSHMDEGAPYLAAAIVTVLTAIYSFFGHSRITFRSQDADIPRP